MEAPQQWEKGGRAAASKPYVWNKPHLPGPYTAARPFAHQGWSGTAPRHLQLCSLSHLCLQVEDLFLTFAKKASASTAGLKMQRRT